MSQLPDFDEAAEALADIKAPFDPSETHGLICAFICADPELDGEKTWLQAIEGVEPNDIATRIFHGSQKQFRANNLTLQLLLPDEEAELELRTKALAHWCRGFLAGVGLAEIKIEQYSQDFQELIQDFTAISQAQHESLKDNEQNEEDFTEISEYVRMAALFIFTEVRTRIERNKLNTSLH